MSKLSFRARALDANKSLPVYHEEDVPDLPDIASVNRVVPQMPTGMEKEEETEHHLQRAISAQQIYGEAQRLIIPTPDAILTEIHDNLPKKSMVHMPKQLIHVQAFTLEDELPDYDCDEEDLKWLGSYNKKNSTQNITTIDFEKMMDTLEKGCSSRLDLFTINDALALIKKDEKIVRIVFDYWKEKRTKENSNLTPTVRTEKKDGSTLHDPYVAFRRRIEKMQTRKNRKNDEASYEKMLKLRRDLNRACLILEMVKLREEKKRNLLQTTIKILETRYSNKDFNGELLHQCYDLLKQRQFQQEQPLATNNNTVKGMGSTDRIRESMDERMKRVEDEARKRHKLLKQRTHLMSASDTVDSHAPGASQTHHPAESVAAEGPDGKFTFRRKKGVIYHAPRYDSMGNWPWTHPVEGGSADSRYCYCCTSVQRRCRCIGFARRRVGRGGRILFDRAYTPYDRHLVTASKKSPTNGMKATFQTQVPPWPHFKPQLDSCSDEEDGYSRPQKYIHPRFRKDSLNSNNDSKSDVVRRPVLCRSFSTQPTSKFRIHPYPSRTSNNHLQSSINNQVFLALLAKNVESQHWVLRRTKNNRLQSVSGVNLTGPAANTSLHMTISPSRPASTAPSSAIYQLNFPLSTTSTSCKTAPPVTNNNVIHRKPINTVVSNGVLTNHNASSLDHNVRSQAMLITTQPIVSRQSLSIVQQQPFITQKVIPQNTVQMSSLQVQPVTAVRGSKLSISKGLAITHAPVVSNGITTSAVPGVQLAR